MKESVSDEDCEAHLVITPVAGVNYLLRGQPSVTFSATCFDHYQMIPHLDRCMYVC